MNNLEISAPMALNASVTLSAGELQTADMDRLTSPYRTPMVIDAMLFTTLNIPGGGEGGGSSAWGNFVGVKIECGNYALSRVPVPLSLHGPQLADSGTSFGFESVNYSSFYYWRLARPLLVLPGEGVSPTFSRKQDGISGEAEVNITYLCRRLPPNFKVPKNRDIPWIGVFNPGPFDVGAGPYASSNELDLANQFMDKPLHIQRFLGRQGYKTDSNSVASDITATIAGNSYGNVKLTLSDEVEERTVLRDFAPFFHVFNINRRSLEMPVVLQPKQRVNATWVGTGGVDTSQNIYPMISMVGHRSERT